MLVFYYNMVSIYATENALVVKYHVINHNHISQDNLVDLSWTAFTFYFLFLLGGGGSCILVTYGRTTNKVTLTASYMRILFWSTKANTALDFLWWLPFYIVTINAAWVIYYWGLNDTRIVYSYNAKSRHQGNRQSQKQRNGFSYRILIRDLWEILGLLFDMRTEPWLFRLSRCN